ncbi:MAG: hypothetical protein NTY17_05725 [Planctomycetia bacterium]|nr:hypothetical protein [Planctomycetia bacterium]
MDNFDELLSGSGPCGFMSAAGMSAAHGQEALGDRTRQTWFKIRSTHPEAGQSEDEIAPKKPGNCYSAVSPEWIGARTAPQAVV